jgi:hypothetical protein
MIEQSLAPASTCLVFPPFGRRLGIPHRDVLPELSLDPELPLAGGRDDDIVELEARRFAQPQTRQEARPRRASPA